MASVLFYHTFCSLLLCQVLLSGCQTSLPGGGQTAAPGAQISQVQPSLRPTNLQIRGQIAGEAGVEVAVENSPYRTRTDAKGHFSLADVPADSARHLLAYRTLTDGSREALRLPLSSNQATLDLQSLLLAPSGSIVGQLQADDAAVDLSGTLVFIPGTSFAAYSDAEGHFFLPHLPAGRYTLVAQQPGYQRSRASVQVESGKPSLVALRLGAHQSEAPDSASLQGRTAADATALAGVQIQLARGSHTALSDENGRYRLTGVPPGTYQLQASRTGYRVLQQEVTLSSGEQTLDIVLQPEADLARGTLRGRVLDAEGQPIAAARIETRPAAGVAESDANGYFELADLLPGSYLLRALRHGALQAQGLASLDSGQTVDVPLQGILSLQAAACAQSNQNQIQVNAPGSTVKVNISNQNSCQVRF